jgi:hypothetical protein
MKLSEFKEAVKNVLRERSINAISKLQQRNIENIASALEFYKKNKHTDKKEPFIKLLKKLGKEKAALAKELDMKVSGMYKNAEYKGESVNEGSDIYINNRIQITKFSGGKDGKLIQINAPKIQGSGDHIIMKIDDFKKMLKKSSNLLKQVQESVNEGPSSEEKRIAMLAVKKQAKYRNVSLSQAIQDQINALEELKRQYKGK